jgi:hypothetical protein
MPPPRVVPHSSTGYHDVREYMRMSIRNRDEADMAAFRAAHP